MKAKSLIALILITLYIFSICGCVIEVSRPENKRDLTIIFLEKEIREYIRKARAGEGDQETLYKEIVLEPVQRELTARNSSLKIENYQKPIIKLDELEQAIGLLSANNVTGIVEAALEKSNNYIEGVDTLVFIFPCDPGDSFTRDSMKGVRGVSGLSCATSILSVNPLAPDWQKTLSYVTAHEYHHVTWGIRHGHQFAGNVLEVLILEGRADSFANIVYPGLSLPWTSSLGKEKEREVWRNTVKDNLDNTDLVFTKNLTLDEFWSGYAIGYHIVQAFIANHPEVGVEEWTGMTAEELFQNSGYEDWLAN